MFRLAECLSPTIFILILMLDIALGSKPNIVILMADDVGFGDLGCYGNTSLRTPNIDSLAKDGVMLTQHIATASMCTPSRAAFLTGRYQSRSGMTSTDQFRVSFFAASKGGLPPSEITLGELAKSAGYKTSFIGKWHMGTHDSYFSWDYKKHPQNQGYDSFYGFPITNFKDFGNEGDNTILSKQPHMNQIFFAMAVIVVITGYTVRRLVGTYTGAILVLISLLSIYYVYFSVNNFKFLSSMLYRNKEVVEQPLRLRGMTHRLVQEGQEFMEERKSDGYPFLLHMSWIHAHTYLDPSNSFKGRSKHGRYGDCVEELDWAVGEILRSLDELGMRDNTLVYFTSDNGGHLEERGNHREVDGGCNGIYRGGKTHGTVDGGIRVPGIVRWPGQVREGMVSDAATSLMDVYPLVAMATGTLPPADRHIDGRDILPILQGKTDKSPHEFLFHYCPDELHAVRYMPKDSKTVWKLAYRLPDYLPNTDVCEYACESGSALVLDPPLLFDLTSDPAEQQPIKIDSSPEHQRIASVIEVAAKEHIASIVPVEKQFTILKSIWMPQLQECCNFPSCICTDPKYPNAEDV